MGTFAEYECRNPLNEPLDSAPVVRVDVVGKGSGRVFLQLSSQRTPRLLVAVDGEAAPAWPARTSMLG